MQGRAFQAGGTAKAEILKMSQFADQTTEAQTSSLVSDPTSWISPTLKSSFQAVTPSLKHTTALSHYRITHSRCPYQSSRILFPITPNTFYPSSSPGSDASSSTKPSMLFLGRAQGLVAV